MNSIREQIILSVLETLKPVAQKYGADLRRAPSDSYDEDEPPVLAVFPEADVIGRRSNMLSERTLTLRIVPQVFDKKCPDTKADEILVDVHKALFANRNLGGLAMGLDESDTEWLSESGDVVAGQIPARYEISYRTQQVDLSVKG